MKVNVDSKLIQDIAHLARLEFEGEAETTMVQDINNILTWIEKLDELDTTGIEPLTHISEEVNVLRFDEVKPHLSHDKALFNAPEKDASYFRVPKVME